MIDVRVFDMDVYVGRYLKIKYDFIFDNSFGFYLILICWYYYYFMKIIIYSLLKENNSIDFWSSVFCFLLNFYGV